MTVMTVEGRRSIRSCVRAGSRRYDRDRDLPRLIPAMGLDGRGLTQTEIVRSLARRLRAERARGRAGHWSYDLNRHIALWQALRAERTVHKAA